jgi:hypothetical protein
LRFAFIPRFKSWVFPLTFIKAYRKLYGRKPTRNEINDPTEKSTWMIKTDISLKNDYTERTLRRQIDGIIMVIKKGGLLKKAK